jgi:hypothetical protein
MIALMNNRLIVIASRERTDTALFVSIVNCFRDIAEAADGADTERRVELPA